VLGYMCRKRVWRIEDSAVGVMARWARKRSLDCLLTIAKRGSIDETPVVMFAVETHCRGGLCVSLRHWLWCWRGNSVVHYNMADMLTWELIHAGRVTPCVCVQRQVDAAVPRTWQGGWKPVEAHTASHCTQHRQETGGHSYSTRSLPLPLVHPDPISNPTKEPFPPPPRPSQSFKYQALSTWTLNRPTCPCG
jgi:hypothetical protein